MNINTASWHYKVWEFSHFGSFPPEKTNLCSYVQRIIFVAPAWCLMIGIVAAFCIPIYLFVCIPMAAIGGYRPAFKAEPFVKYPGLPLGKFQLYPWHVLLTSLFLLLEWYWFHFQGWVQPVAIQGGTLGVIGLIFLICWMTVSFPETETVKLLKAWSASRNNKFCPTITFTTEPTSNSLEE